jgi:mannose-6-phosphate isomerase-like protein (cupin superfamily)
MPYSTIQPDDFEWITRPHEPGEPARHVAELSERIGFADVRANIWRYEPGAKGRRHRHPTQEETFVVLAGTLSMYVGDPPERVDIPAGGAIRVDPGTPLQAANHGDEELLVYAHGYPPESENAEILDPAV